MDIKTTNTPEKLSQAIGTFLQSDYSHENLVTMYNDTRKGAIGFRGVYSALPALPAYRDNPLDGLQDIMDWCNESSKVVDDIVSHLEQQIISETINQLKKLRGFADRVISLVDNSLKEQAQKEARAKVEKEYKNLNEEASKAQKMPLLEQIEIIGKLEIENLMILRRETEDVVQIYLSKNPTFKDRLSQSDREINEVLETLNKLVGSNTPTGKLLDIYCKLKDIPLQRQFDDVGYAYSPIDDLTDIICSGCNRLYTSVDNVIKTFEEIQTKAKQKADRTIKPVSGNKAGENKEWEARNGKPQTQKNTHQINRFLEINFIKATIKHLPYCGAYLFDLIYGVDGVKTQKKELAERKIDNAHRPIEQGSQYIKAGGNIIAGGDIIIGNGKTATKTVEKKPLYKKVWPYVIGGLSFLALLTTLWLNIDKIKEQFSPKKTQTTSLAEKQLPGNYKLEISAIDISARDPLWGHESFDDDEVVVKISGQANLFDVGKTNVVVAFWRLANDFETNWHAGRRRDGGNYKLAMIEPAIASAGNWDFLVGGIECKKTYEGDVAIVLLLYPESIVQEQSYAWEQDSNGWGFRKLPEGYLATSAVKTFRTIPKRK